MASKIEMKLPPGEIHPVIIAEWLKSVGEEVKKDEAIGIFETEKITIEIISPADGILLKINFPKGSLANDGDILGWVGKPGEKLPTENNEKNVEESFNNKGDKEKNAAGNNGDQIKISPIAKKLAKINNLDINLIERTGPGGRITEKDVVRYLEKKQRDQKEEIIHLSSKRKIIAEKMLKSVLQIPQVTNFIEIDITDLLKIRKEMINSGEIKFSINDLFILVTAEAIKQNKIINSTFVNNDVFKIFSDINIGIAVDTPDGLVVPVLKNVGKMSLYEISKHTKVLIEKAMSGKLLFDDIQDGTFTITNLGNLGTDFFTPIINLPQSAILGIGTIKKKPLIVKDNILIRDTIILCLSYDHRIIDGAPAARFLGDIKKLLEEDYLKILRINKSC